MCCSQSSRRSYGHSLRSPVRFTTVLSINSACSVLLYVGGFVLWVMVLTGIFRLQDEQQHIDFYLLVEKGVVNASYSPERQPERFSCGGEDQEYSSHDVVDFEQVETGGASGYCAVPLSPAGITNEITPVFGCDADVTAFLNAPADLDAAADLCRDLCRCASSSASSSADGGATTCAGFSVSMSSSSSSGSGGGYSNSSTSTVTSSSSSTSTTTFSCRLHVRAGTSCDSVLPADALALDEDSNCVRLVFAPSSSIIIVSGSSSPSTSTISTSTADTTGRSSIAGGNDDGMQQQQQQHWDVAVSGLPAVDGTPNTVCYARKNLCTANCLGFSCDELSLRLGISCEYVGMGWGWWWW
jgi:hypothetical protein